MQSEYERLSHLGVEFIQGPTDVGTAVIAVLDDTCGNLIQLIAPKPEIVDSASGANSEAGDDLNR